MIVVVLDNATDREGRRGSGAPALSLRCCMRASETAKEKKRGGR